MLGRRVHGQPGAVTVPRRQHLAGRADRAVNPFQRPNTPRSAREIADRINEISFNGPLIQELRHLDFINRTVRSGDLKHQGYQEVFLHSIRGGEEISRYPTSTKLNAEWSFLKQLRDAGHDTVARWLEANFEPIGRKTTMRTSSHLKFARPADGLKRLDE